MAVSREKFPWKTWSASMLLERGAGEIGIRIDRMAVDNLLKYLTELIKWNQKINLIGPGDLQEQVIIHLLDALCLLAHMDGDAVHFADVGSGGGIPGLVLKIARPTWTGLLIEARSKRAGFLRHMVRQMNLEGMDVHEGRLTPDVCRRIGNSFGLVTLRGFASLKESLDLAAPLMAQNARLAAYKGPHYEDELHEARGLISEYGLSLEKAAAYDLPFIGRKRALVLLQKKIR